MSGHTPTLSLHGATGGPFDLPAVLMVRLRTELMRERADRQQRQRRRLRSDPYPSTPPVRPYATVRNDLPR